MSSHHEHLGARARKSETLTPSIGVAQTAQLPYTKQVDMRDEQSSSSAQTWPQYQHRLSVPNMTTTKLLAAVQVNHPRGYGPELTYLSSQWLSARAPPLYSVWMASSEVDQKFLGHFAKSTSIENNYLSRYLTSPLLPLSDCSKTTQIVSNLGLTGF